MTHHDSSKSESESRTQLSVVHGLYHGILQARILQWVAIPFSRGSSQPSDQTQVSRLAGGFFAIRAPRETPCSSQSCIIIQKGCFGIATLSTSWLGTENTRHLAGGRTDSPKGVMTFIVHHV